MGRDFSLMFLFIHTCGTCDSSQLADLKYMLQNFNQTALIYFLNFVH